MESHGRMNKTAIKLALCDAAVGIDGILEDIESGEFDEHSDMAMASQLAYVLSNLCVAWHRMRLSDEEIDAMTSEDYEAHCTAIPKWDMSCRLVELHESPI